MTKETMCPATMCPYLGLSQGSPWTNEKESNCKGDDCGWWHDGSCIAGGELKIGSIEKYGEPTGEKPPCQFEDECQWEAESEGACPPRAALMAGADPDDTQLLSEPQ